jgi:hypothetical protein
MTLLDALMADRLQDILGRARDVLGSHATLGEVESTLKGFRVNAETYRETRHGIEADPDLSAEGKQRRLEQAYQQHLSQQQALISKAQSAANTLVGQLERHSQPAPLHSDERAAQALLGNARSDARMMLDGVPVKNLTQHMGDLAQGDDPAIRHLLLATPWPVHYLKARGASAQEWEAARAERIGAAYGEARGRSVKALQYALELREELPGNMQAALEPAPAMDAPEVAHIERGGYA